MNQKQMEAGKYLSELDEYVPALVRGSLKRQFNLTDREVDEVLNPEPVEYQKKQSTGRCHYCGMPAKSFGFFGEPVCKECGG